MDALCQLCNTINLNALFFNNFSSFARFLPLLTELEDDEQTYLESESAVVARDREHYLDDATFDYHYEHEKLQQFLDVIEYTDSRDPPIVKQYFEQKLHAPLFENEFVYALGTVSELHSRASSCQSCRWLSDQRVWRLSSTCDTENAEGNHRHPSAVHPSWNCYLLPIWPVWKSLRKNIYDAANELYVLPVPTKTDLPLYVTDDGFYSYTRDLRTIGLFDNAQSIWTSVPPLVDWSTVKRWITSDSTDSNVQHDLGKPQSESFMLVDLRKDTIITIPTLDGYQYAALSYVWGKAKVSEPWCQDIQRIHDQKLGQPVPINRQRLPLTVQGALEICDKLDIQYLWVDSLCISQNILVEKSQAIGDMGHIYLGAYLCIIAAADANVHNCLPGVNTARSSYQSNFDGVIAGITPPWPSDAVSTSIWSTRGWTFQEAILPNRSLVILPDQVFLQYGRSVRCESANIDVGNTYKASSEDYWPEPLTTFGLYTEEDNNGEPTTDLAPRLFSIYKDMAQDYSGRNWSDPADVDNAFKGLSVVLRSRFGIEFRYALPIETFAQSSNWMRQSSRLSLYRRRDQKGHLLFPSYSWLSVVGRITYTTLPASDSLIIEPGFESLPVPDHELQYPAFPAIGFESHFATETLPGSTMSRNSHNQPTPALFLKGAIPLTARLYPLHLHAIAVNAGHRPPFLPHTLISIAKSLTINLDDLETLPSGQLYLLPTVSRPYAEPEIEPTPDLKDSSARTGGRNAAFISVALIVQLWAYTHASVSSWPGPEPLTATTKSPAGMSLDFNQDGPDIEPISHILTTLEADTQIFLARRVGIIPHSHFPLQVNADAERVARVLLA